MIELGRVHCLQTDTCVATVLQKSMLNGSCSAKIWQQRWMYVETAIRSTIQDPRRHKETKGYSDDQIDRLGWAPSFEGIDLVNIEAKVGGKALDRYWEVSINQPLIDFHKPTVPSRICLSPLPTFLSGLQTTSMLAIFDGCFCWR